MGEHGVDLARIRGQVGLGDSLVRVGAGDVGEQLFEIADIAIDGGAEFRLAVIFALDLIEGLLALQRVEAAGKDVALATLITAPEIDRGIVVDGAGDIDRERVQRFHDMAWIAAVVDARRRCGCFRRAGRGPGRRLVGGFISGCAAQKIADPAAAFPGRFLAA